MLAKTTSFFDYLMRRYTPDPFLFAVLLSFLVFLLGCIVGQKTVEEMFLFWGQGFWALLSFTLQMAMILLTGYVVATSNPVKRALKSFASMIRSQGKAIFVTTFLSALGCWLNWGFGLIVGAFICRSIIQVHPTYNYRILVASAYSGFLVWHGGLSGSIPLLLATPGNFSENSLGRLFPLSETIGLPLNIIAVLGLFILLPLTNYFIGKHNPDHQPSLDPSLLLESEEIEPEKHPKTPAEKLESSRLISYLLFGLALFYLFFSIKNKTFSLNLNTINLIFLFIGVLLHKTPKNFLKATSLGAKKVSPILIQYPFYAGIMAMMQKSGLALIISNLFVQISTVKTFAFFTFLSAGLVNFFIPSGGGQWAVQSPIVIPAAQELGADLAKSIMAVAWGDAWTNMAQPFWALPLLSVAGLKIRDIMGFCVSILIVSGLWLSFLFLTL